ncbi:hypothetical protein DFH07DRAFT_917204 [Mycena maculata]|uniref:F-box domain-containing protein n=1 Tax=Mycena maculata TaxID=230809 RepID=A0AAD7JED7_9AGAR|nr:hypothetical protein DFH07DRAFT_917204 [Mycena maculata]
MARRRKDSIDREAGIVDAQLAILRSREADIQRILDDMQRLKESVSAERQKLEARHKELHSERQPINWLPAELLIQIFVTFTEADLDSHDPSEVYHRAPVIISHVSSRWRSISLETSRMWSRISLQSTIWNARSIVAFLARSGKAPLDIVFISPMTMTFQEEHRRTERLVTHISYDIRRIRSVAFQSRGPEAMQKLVGILTLPANIFSSLRSLNLSVVSLGPSSLLSPSLIPVQFQESGTSLNLTYLRLEKLPLFNMPKHFLPNLITLELSFPPKKSTAEGPNSYMLRMSQVVRFLNCTPKLQELILSTTVPYMDAYLNVEDAVRISDGLQKVSPVDLIHLRTIEWTYPFGPDIHHFLSFLVVPALEKFEVCVEELPVLRANVLLLRGYPDTAASQLFASHRVIELGSLRDLTLQCMHEDTIGSVLRKFAFPVLEKLELTYVSDRGRNASTDGLPTFPRLESMFRDPRLPMLTHLTICRFEISAELGKAEAMLGYMPALVSVTLDACAGVWILLDGLRQRAPVSLGAPAVRVCPRLEALALWRCADVDISPLVGIVIARNGSGGGGHGGLGNINLAASDNSGAAPSKPRAIRPMKKLRRQGQGIVGAGTSTRAPSTNILSSMIANEEASRPARISYVRIEDCALIDEKQALSLRALGVADVVWSSD